MSQTNEEQPTITIVIDKEALTNPPTSIMSGIQKTVCAMLNSNYGGHMRLKLDEESCDLLKNKPNIMEGCMRRIEQCILPIEGVTTVCQLLKARKDNHGLTYTIKPASKLCTIAYNLYLPTDYQIKSIDGNDPDANIVSLLTAEVADKTTIAFPVWSRKFEFTYGGRVANDLRESQTVQFKLLNNEPTTNITLADRMTNSSNKMAMYVSGFANYEGGSLVFGIEDKTYVVHGQVCTSTEKSKIVSKVTKLLGKLLWPVPNNEIEKYWKLDFVPVLGDNGIALGDTFVVVLSVAKCPGGVFTKVPESYHVKDGKVEKLPLNTWKEKFLAGQNKHGDSKKIVGASGNANGTGYINHAGITKGNYNQNNGNYVGNEDWYQNGNTCLAGFADFDGNYSYGGIHPSMNLSTSGNGLYHQGNCNISDSSFLSENDIPYYISVKKWSSPKQEHTYMTVMQRMENLRNNGEWQKIDGIASKVLTGRNRNPDMKLSVLFQYIAASYRKKDKAKAEHYLNIYDSLVNTSENAFIFEVHKLYSLSAIKRSERRYGESYTYAYNALQMMNHIGPGWITAWFLCNAANLLIILAGETTDLSDKENNMTWAEHYYVLALDHAQSIEQYDQAMANLKHRVHINLAMLYLKTSPVLSSSDSQQIVDDNAIRKAKDNLTSAGGLQDPPMTGFNELHFHLAKSDLHYRLFQRHCSESSNEHLRKSLSCANDALRVAQENDFKEVLHFAQERIRFLQNIPDVMDNTDDFLDELLN